MHAYFIQVDGAILRQQLIAEKAASERDENAKNCAIGENCFVGHMAALVWLGNANYFMFLNCFELFVADVSANFVVVAKISVTKL